MLSNTAFKLSLKESINVRLDYVSNQRNRFSFQNLEVDFFDVDFTVRL